MACIILCTRYRSVVLLVQYSLHEQVTGFTGTSFSTLLVDEIGKSHWSTISIAEH